MFFKKKATFPFFLLFLKTKKVENYKKKKSKEELKKKKESETQKRLLVRISLICFPLLLYMGLKHNTTMFRTPLKRELLLERELHWGKKRLTEKWKQLRRRCILPCTLWFSFFSVGVRGCRSQLKPTARWWGAGWLAAEPFWSLTHFPPPPLSLSVSFSF